LFCGPYGTRSRILSHPRLEFILSEAEGLWAKLFRLFGAG